MNDSYQFVATVLHNVTTNKKNQNHFHQIYLHFPSKNLFILISFDLHLTKFPAQCHDSLRGSDFSDLYKYLLYMYSMLNSSQHLVDRIDFAYKISNNRHVRY